MELKYDIMNNLEHIKSQIKPVLEKYGIKKAGIFGSSARGESVVNDLDLLVKIEIRISLLEFTELQQETEDIWSMQVDMVECDAIKPAFTELIMTYAEPGRSAKGSWMSSFRRFWRAWGNAGGMLISFPR